MTVEQRTSVGEKGGQEQNNTQVPHYKKALILSSRARGGTNRRYCKSDFRSSALMASLLSAVLSK
jgi:hypothetical protein